MTPSPHAGRALTSHAGPVAAPPALAPGSGRGFLFEVARPTLASQIPNREDKVAIVGKVHHHGTLTGARADAATRLPEQVSVYLCFRTPDDKQENVEISVHEAALLHGWLANIVSQAQGR